MKFLEKTATLGEMTFKIQTNRDIAIKTFEQFPDLMEYLIKKQGKAANNDNDFFIQALKNKELGELFDMEDKIQELIKFALPLMLESAKDTTNASEIFKYAEQNNALSIFNNAMLEFLMQGFTQRGMEEPKIRFSMK